LLWRHLLRRHLLLLNVEVSNTINIFVYCLEVTRVQVLDGLCFSAALLYLMDDGLEHGVSVVVEQSLQKFVLVVSVVYLDDEGVYFGDLVLQVHLLLGLDHVYDLFRFFAQFRKLLEHHRDGGVGSGHEEVHELCLTHLGVFLLGQRHLLGCIQVQQVDVLQEAKQLAVHDKQRVLDLLGYGLLQVALGILSMGCIGRVLLHLVVPAREASVGHSTVADALHSVLDRRLRRLVSILLYVYVQLVDVDHSGTVTTLEVVDGAPCLRHGLHSWPTLRSSLREHACVLLRLCNSTSLLGKVFLGSIVLHLLVGVQVRGRVVP
jgi:hypothetical protein